MNSAQPNVTGKKAYSIEEFCRAHGISIAFYYKLKKAGKAPREMAVGTRRLVSEESGAAWRNQMEAV
jgi:hypothetical protein